jgi:predicted dithiol-disulfide oxidoreductase (DUF899 family)
LVIPPTAREIAAFHRIIASGRHLLSITDGMAESPGWHVFALEDGVVYHTYSRTAPDRFLLAPYYYQLLDQIPDGRVGDFPLRRHDEY